jgi:membrane-bound lytic murein transglycosylase A
MPTVGADGQITGWKTLTRFVFPQDSGAAIKGTGRVDIFWGDGEYAEIAANHMKEQGKLYFLVKKGYPGE